MDSKMIELDRLYVLFRQSGSALGQALAGPRSEWQRQSWRKLKQPQPIDDRHSVPNLKNRHS